MTSTTTVSGDPAATTFSDTAALTLIATGLVALVAPVGVQVLWLALLILITAVLRGPRTPRTVVRSAR